MKSAFRLLLPATAAALILLIGSDERPASAATINVACNTVALTAAIDAANNNTTNPGPDTLELTPGCNYVYSTPSIPGNALPAINSTITINGHGATINRDSAAAERFRIIFIQSPGSVTINETTIRGGRALHAPSPGHCGEAGGGIRVQSGSLTIVNSTVTDNQAGNGASTGPMEGNGGCGGQGGGITAIGGSVTVIGSTISSNRSGDGAQGGPGAPPTGGLGGSGGPGGGISGSFTIVNSTISGNIAGSGATGGAGGGNGGDGGGLYHTAGNSQPLTNVTVAFNSAGIDGPGPGGSPGTGAGVYLAAGAVAKNTIVANNGPGGDCGGFPFNTGTTHSLDSDTSCGAITGLFMTSSFINLSPLANNGGPTLTHALNYPSTAIDAGDDFICATSPVNGLDQRGEIRPIDGDSVAGAVCDIGSFEAPPSQSGPDFTVNSTAPDDDGLCHQAPGDCTLREAIDAANSNPTPSVLDLATGATYTLNQVDNGANGLPLVTTNIMISGHDSTIRRDPAGPRFRLLQVNATGGLHLEDLTLAEGYPPDGAGGDGGAIHVTGGTAGLVRSEVTANRAGGGVESVAGGLGGHGGGVYVNGGFIFLDGSTVNGNVAGGGALGANGGGGNGGNGGGLALFGAGFQIGGSTINSNFAGFAGYALTQVGGGGQGGQGGGVFLSSTSSGTIANTTVASNTSGSGGGGGQFSGLGGNGGGVRTQSPNVTLSHVTLSNNNAGSGGPGAANGSGGGISDAPGVGVTVKNTLMVAGTVGTNCAAVISTGSGGNISTDSSCGTTYFVQRTPAQINLAAALAENGGPSRTLALTPPSAAIDTAIDPACSGDPIYYRDQRGEMRFSDGDGIGGPQCDVGAYEYCPDIDDDDVCLSQDNCPAWTNQDQTLPNWLVPAEDPDCDGWNNTREAHVGTDPTKHCNNDSTLNNEPDAWPTDFNDSLFTNLADVSSFNPTYNKLQGDDGYSKRHDLNASNGVTLSDVSLMNNFYNKGCG